MTQLFYVGEIKGWQDCHGVWALFICFAKTEERYLSAVQQIYVSIQLVRLFRNMQCCACVRKCDQDCRR